MSQPDAQLFTDDARLSVSEDGRTIEGYAIVWNTPSNDRGGYRVKLSPGSATFTTPTHALMYHDKNRIIGTTENGSLRLKPDDVGVRFELDLPDTTDGNDAYKMVKGKLVTGISFGMTKPPRGRMVREGGHRVLFADPFEAEEISITGRPSFVTARASVKTAVAAVFEAADQIDIQRAVEARRRDEIRLALLRAV